MICVGLDWAESHHDVVVLAETGELLAELRVGDSLAGVEQIHAVVAPHIAAPAEVVVGTESVHGPVVQALVAAGYTVDEINPEASRRYRDRHHLSGAKSDRGDAKMLADVVRTDRHNHRPYAGSSDLAEAITVLARAHQSLINRRQAHLNEVRTTLRQYYPALLVAFPISPRRRLGTALTPWPWSSGRPRQRKASGCRGHRSPLRCTRGLTRHQVAGSRCSAQPHVAHRFEALQKVLPGLGRFKPRLLRSRSRIGT